MSTNLTGVTTCKDITLYIAGRKLGSISEANLTGSSSLKDVSAMGYDYKKNVRTFREFSGSWSMWIEDLESLGLILGEYWVDPTKTESWPTINYDGTQYKVTHVQGSHAGTVTVTTGNKVAQKFRAGGSTLTSTGVKVYNTGSGDASVSVTVEADNSGSPSGTPLDTDTVDFSGGAGWVTADLSSASLTKGNWYWIVASVPTTSTGFGRSSADIYEEWGYKEYTGTWGSLEDNDISFYIETEDNSVSMVIELTDGVNTHVFNADIGPGSGSFSVTVDEPISAEVSYTAKTVTYSG